MFNLSVKAQINLGNPSTVVTISSNTTYNNNVNILPYSRVVFTNVKISMGTGFKIKVGIGAVLVLRGTNITHTADNGNLNATNSTWNGIEVEGNISAAQNEASINYSFLGGQWVPYNVGHPVRITSADALKSRRDQYTNLFNQGCLIIEPSSAENNPVMPRISHMSNSTCILMKPGSILISTGKLNPGQGTQYNNFIDNFGTNIRFIKYDSVNYSIIENTSFALSAGLTNVPGLNKPISFLKLEQNKKFYFSFNFNFFKSEYYPSFNTSFVITGIDANSSDFRINQSKFTYVQQGVMATNCNVALVNSNTFWGPRNYAVRSNGGELEVFNNEVYLINTQPCCGFWCTGTTHRILYNNIKCTINKNISNQIRGIQIEKTGTSLGKVNENVIKGASTALWYDRNNNYCTFECNKFEENEVRDIRITGTNNQTDGVYSPQGNKTYGAMNKFNINTPNNTCHINNACRNIDYWYSGGVVNNRNYPDKKTTSTVNTIQSNNAKTCSCDSGWAKAENPPSNCDGPTIRTQLDSVTGILPNVNQLYTLDDSAQYFYLLHEKRYLTNQLINYFLMEATHDTDTAIIYMDSIAYYLNLINEPWALQRLAQIQIHFNLYTNAATSITNLSNFSPSIEGQSDMATILTVYKNWAQNNYDSAWLSQNLSSVLSVASANNWASGLAQSMVIYYASMDSGSSAHLLYPFLPDTTNNNNNTDSSCNMSISAAPNPFANTITFTCTNNESVNLNVLFKIFDINGLEKYSQSLSINANTSQTLTPNLSSLNSGYYFASLYCTNDVKTILLYKE